MDHAYEFEKLMNSYIGTPDLVTYSTYWGSKNKRVSLLFTACLIQYDKNSTGEVGEKLSYFMNELFNENNESKNISIECLNYLKEIK